MKFSDICWKSSLPVYNEILKLPFILELMQGNLSQERFNFYIQQDAIYLKEFCQALIIISSKSEDKKHAEVFSEFERSAVAVEQELHNSFLEGASPDPSPSCLLYTSYMLKQAALEPVQIGVAAVLPCFWVYREAGNHILAHGNKVNNPYQRWINTYGGDEYSAQVDLAVSVFNELAYDSAESLKKKMLETYMLSTKMEWLFWNSAYNMEKWSI
jgi:thiaminase/transcriptional activator TenA